MSAAAQPLSAPLPRRLAVVHGMGAMAYGIKENGFSTFLLLYCNQVLGMDPRMVGLALLIALVIDGVADPVIGYLSDRTVTNWGRRLPWLIFASVPLGVVWAMLWSMTTAPSFWELVGIAVAVRLLVSCCEVPSISLVPELTRDYDQRTTLLRYRFLFSWGASMLISFLAYGVFLKNGPLAGEGYRAYGLFGAVMISGSVLFSALGQKRWAAVRPPAPATPFSLRRAFGELIECFSHPAFGVLLLGGALAYTSQGITFSMANYLYSYVWRFTKGDFQIYTIVLLLSVVACFVLLPAWHARWGKRDTAVVTALLGMVFWVSPFLLNVAGLWPQVGSMASTLGVFSLFFICNVFSVAAMVSATSMMADVVEASEEQTGRRNEGVFFAGNFFMTKCTTGIGIFVTSQLLAFAGISDRIRPEDVPADVINRLSLGYCAAVIVFAIAMAMVIRRFPITRADHEARLAALAAARINPDAEGMHP